MRSPIGPRLVERPFSQLDETDNLLTLSSYRPGLLARDPACVYQRVELRLVLPCPAEVWRDDEVQRVVVHLDASLSPRVRVLEVHVPGPKLPTGIPEETDAIRDIGWVKGQCGRFNCALIPCALQFFPHV